MKHRSVVAAAIAFAVSGLVPALAAEPAGEAVAVVQAASAAGPAGSRVLERDSTVFMGDLVRTDAGGLAQIKFLDDTRMVVGPNSELTIDRFVYAGGATASQVTIGAVRGAFRFITGNSPKTAYSIDTPVATIGVRGTMFDFTILDDNTANLVFYGDGGVRYCDKQKPRHCADITDACTVVVVTPQQEFEWISDVYKRAKAIDDLFPFAFGRWDLLDGFQINTASCDIRTNHVPSVGDGAPPPRQEPPPPTEG